MGDSAVNLRRRRILQTVGVSLLFFENWRAC